jgi:predicted RNA-binding Zn-ribbon protein involved in translation (DUF1610 family)
MFKEKSSKKKISNDNNDTFTLDAMHNNIIKGFGDSDKQKEKYNLLLSSYESEIDGITTELERCDIITNKERGNMLWSKIIILREKKSELKLCIKELNTYDEIDYYKNTSYILFQYYETVDKQSDINNNQNKESQNTIVSTNELLNRQPKIYKNYSKKKRSIVSATTINVLDALNNIDSKAISINNCDETDKCDNIIEDTQAINYKTDQYIDSNNTEDTLYDKSALVDKYMSIINKQYVRNVEDKNIEMCKVCNNQMTCLQQDAIMICNMCGYQELLLVEQNRPILKQNTKDTSHFCYKRINHFREWCNQVQGKESTDIPDDIFEKILTEIKKEKIIDLKSISYVKMRDILKRLRINKYYEHINYIINRINGIPTPQFSPELEERLCSMFRNIQAPFLKHCPKDRKNFLSYSYVLYKFFQILGLNEYLKYFPLLKSREKLYVQDQIWKNICIELNYDIIPSL